MTLIHSTQKRSFLPLLFATSLFSMAVTVASAQTSPPVQQESKIAGARTCFWYRGPFSADPYINLAYPDANVFYWAANFAVPEGANLHLEGDYAHSRYQSLISYKDLSSEILNILRSKRDEIIFKMKITSKEETDILIKRVENLEKKIEILEKKKLQRQKNLNS